MSRRPVHNTAKKSSWILVAIFQKFFTTVDSIAELGKVLEVLVLEKVRARSALSLAYTMVLVFVLEYDFPRTRTCNGRFSTRTRESRYLPSSAQLVRWNGVKSLGTHLMEIFFIPLVITDDFLE